jgi:transcriptional regulator with XRE-family HTH domain
MSTDVLILEGMTDGRRVKVARAVKGWRQIDLAVHAGVSVGMISALESGFSIPTATRKKIFDVLGLTHDSR